MVALHRCDELRRAVNSQEWEDMFILYCRRATSDDLRSTKEINRKDCRVMKETQGKYTEKFLKLQILGREFEMSVREKNLFIERLKGNMDS
ncbi:hypothetical protein Tco_0399861 [Tanacetum coccineum]